MKTLLAILAALSVLHVCIVYGNKPGEGKPVNKPFKAHELETESKDPKRLGKLVGNEEKVAGIQIDRGASDEQREKIIRQQLVKEGKLDVDEQNGKVRLVRAGVQGKGVPGSFILTIKEGAKNKDVKKMLRRVRLNKKNTKVQFSKTTFILVDNIDEGTLGDLRDYNDEIKEIEQNMVVHLTDDCPTSQVSNALWGLDRLDSNSSDGQMTAWGDGTDIDLYIIDTGVLNTHEDFGGRVELGWSSITNDLNSVDDHGHGTHVAGTAAGTLYGVAKNANIIAVKVLSGSGSGSSAGVLRGIQWVVDRVLSSKKLSIVNMSLGGSYSAAGNLAQKELREAGVFSAVAAGNDDEDACGTSPASAPDAITVASTTKLNIKSGFSNWGGCVDIHAPGSSIMSAYHTSDTATRTLSGTSMASPHVAGVAASLASTFKAKGWFAETSPTAVDWLESYIKLFAQEGVISGVVPGTTEKMLHMECLNMEQNNS